VVVYQGTAVGGGGPQGGSAVHCSWAVRPYLDDLEHATRVLLTPEHYALRSGSAQVSATAGEGGWTLSATEAATFHLDYEVVDKATGEVVLRQKMDLACGPTPERDAPAPLPSPAFAPPRRDLPRLDPPKDPPPRTSGLKDMQFVYLAVGLGVAHAAFTTTVVGLGIDARHLADGDRRSAEQLAMGLLVVPTVITGITMMASIASVHPAPPKRRRAALGVHLAPTDRARGAVAGVAGSF
jgi:hypothetical protein